MTHGNHTQYHTRRYPDIKHIGMMKGREPKSLLECNGFCGANDFEEIDLFENLNLEETDA